MCPVYADFERRALMRLLSVTPNMANPKSTELGSGIAANVPTGNAVAEPLIADWIMPYALESVLTIKKELDSPTLTLFTFPVNGVGGWMGKSNPTLPVEP